MQKEYPNVTILKTPKKLCKNKPVLVSENFEEDVPDYEVGHIALIKKVKLPKDHPDGLVADCWFQEANKTEKKFKTEAERIGNPNPNPNPDYSFNIHFHRHHPDCCFQGKPGWYRKNECWEFCEEGDTFGGYKVTNVNYLHGKLAPKEKDDCFKCTVAKITKGRKISLLVAGKNKNKSRQPKLSKTEVIDQMYAALEKTSLAIAKKSRHKRATQKKGAAVVVDPAAKPAAAADAVAAKKGAAVVVDPAAKPAVAADAVAADNTVNAAAVVDPAPAPAAETATTSDVEAGAADNTVNAAAAADDQKPAADAAAAKVLEMATIISLAEARDITELQRIGERIAKHLAENGPGLGALYPHGVSARRVCMAYPHAARHICRVVPSICAAHICTAYPQCA